MAGMKGIEPLTNDRQLFMITISPHIQFKEHYRINLKRSSNLFLLCVDELNIYLACGEGKVASLKA